MQQRFLLQFLLLAQHVSGTTMPIIRNSRVLYSGCCMWYFVLWFSSCWSGVELRVMCPVCRMLQHPANRTHVEQAIRSAIKTSVVSSWHFISTYYLSYCLRRFRKFAIAPISFVISVHPSVCPHRTTGLPRNGFLSIFRKTIAKMQIPLKSHKNNGYFTWKPIYVFDHISLSSS